MAQPHIILTGGGTGGHVTPLVAIAEALGDKAQISVVIENGDSASREAFRDLPVTVYEVKAGKLRRYHGSKGWYFFHPVNILENIRDSGRLVHGFASSVKLLRRLKPDVVFVKGGYVALPVGLAAASLSVPIITHDSDVLPGLTNRIIARWAAKIAVGFPREHYAHYPARKLTHVGIPLRQEFLHLVHKEKGSQVRTIFIIGGSSGAQHINQLVLSVGKQLMKEGKIIHVTGKKGFKAVSDVTREWQASGRYHVYDYLGKELFKFMAEADIAVTRAGATTLTEYAIAGVPMIVIPSPHLTGGHQLQNALVLEQSSAAVVLGEAQLKKQPELLVSTVRELLDEPKKCQWLVRNARSLLPADASERLAELLLETARKASAK